MNNDFRNDSIKALEKELMELGITPSSALLDKYVKYMEGLLQANESINLTAITAEDEFIEKHYIDSLAALKLEEMKEAKRIADLGTGGGFPGIPLALACPDKSFTLMDSLAKRLAVIDELAEECDINNVSTLHGRAEEIGRMPEHRDSYDICISRAVAALPVLAELCLPLVKVGGYFIAYKSKAVNAELQEGEFAIKTLGGQVERLEDVSTEEEKRFLLVVKKISKTPEKYPRKPGMPTKRPLK